MSEVIMFFIIFVLLCSMIHISMDAREAMKEYQCQYCPKQFLRRSVLLMHEASHTGEHKYQCDCLGVLFLKNLKNGNFGDF